MRTIKIKVPNKSYNKEWEVVDAVGKLLDKMKKDLNVEIHRGQGGTLDDWSDKDFDNKEGMLMVFKVSLNKEDALKRAEKLFRKAERQYNRGIKLKDDKIEKLWFMSYAQIHLEGAKKYLMEAKN